MRIGTKSLLFGVHQFIWHPLTVLIAWRKLYRRWPTRWEALAILVHDWGYWGKPNMDGPEGETHPQLGADLVFWLYKRIAADPTQSYRWYWFTKYHSRYCAATHRAAPSVLCWADKLSVWYDPEWFYLLRAGLSGEIVEYRRNASKFVPTWLPNPFWFRWYREKVKTVIENKIPATAGHHQDEK